MHNYPTLETWNRESFWSRDRVSSEHLFLQGKNRIVFNIVSNKMFRRRYLATGLSEGATLSNFSDAYSGNLSIWGVSACHASFIFACKTQIPRGLTPPFSRQKRMRKIDFSATVYCPMNCIMSTLQKCVIQNLVNDPFSEQSDISRPDEGSEADFDVNAPSQS